MPLSELNDPGREYLVNDTCIIEAEVVPGCTVCSELMPKPIPATQSGETVSLPKNPRPGQLFEEGRHGLIDETYENIGGFSILKAQAPVYKLIWLKYGHIASSKVLSASYDAQVLIVADTMKFVIEMHQSRPNELSTEIVNTWEEKIKMAESLDFHVEWIRERLEEVKKDLHGRQKLEVEFEELSQSLSGAHARVTRADNEVKKLESELLAAKDESVKAQENKAALESTIRPVLPNVEMCLGKALLGFSYSLKLLLFKNYFVLI
ncbi:MATH domain and coiled-coil domain-containing protein At3g58210-like [Papaver somniferum]|uniref:MATH domain and coiled-coil domain-containing protein At3g58210-like n=1 Tax=Papaver somniferum TaxID=3469 RepID=UPI000E6F4D98|nr:MATH domain and coiled-coil domain-containing protein At3g58210-like [Papaver somniferum]